MKDCATSIVYPPFVAGHRVGVNINACVDGVTFEYFYLFCNKFEFAISCDDYHLLFDILKGVYRDS